MSRLNKAKGNMYSGWVTHTWSPINGCEHQCQYCYVRKFRELKDYPEINGTFPDLGTGNKIFVCHMADLFASKVSNDIIISVLHHCKKFDNQYIFQTKDVESLYIKSSLLPENSIVGTTIETNRQFIINTISKAPKIISRIEYLRLIDKKKFITIEPIIDFDIDEMLDLLKRAKPDFINLGADSKFHNLPEPTGEKVKQLICRIENIPIKLNCKYNLERLLK